MAWANAVPLVAGLLAIGLGLSGCSDEYKDDGHRAPSHVLLPHTNSAAPTEVRLTWFGISNWVIKIGDLDIMMDGYMTRIPQDNFYGGGGGLAYTRTAWPIDKAAVDKIHGALRAGPGGGQVDLLLTGHSHFDHSFDTPYWAQVTKAPVIGSKTTCLQVQALGVPPTQCTSMQGGEAIPLNNYVTMRVVRWNHSGTHETNPEQHDPVELQAVPVPDGNGNLRGGVAEDFPNGGNRGYLFTVKTAGNGQLTFFVTNSGAAQDLDTDVVIGGKTYGAPLDSLRMTMQSALLDSVDLWIGAGGQPVAALTLPVLKPKAFVPNHLGSFYAPFEQGNTTPFNDATLTSYLASNNVNLVRPAQYLDAWVLDANGVRPVDNSAMKQAYGF